MAYCTIEDVIAYTKPRNAYTDDEKVQIIKFMEDIAAQIKTKLRGAGYVLPITDPSDREYLGMLNAWGAAGLAEKGTGASSNNGPTDSGVDYWNMYQQELALLFSGKVSLDASKPGNLPRALHTSFAADGSDPEISDNTPMFRRDMVN